MSYIREAYEQVVAERKQVEAWYVTLLEYRQKYGGPEEGGWWITDVIPVEFAIYPDEATAEDVAAKVEERAEELTSFFRRKHGERCLQEIEWLEARGLDADYLPESDTYSYIVKVSREPIDPYYGPRHYE